MGNRKCSKKEKMKTIETPIIITSIRSKVDGSLGFSATTPEYSNEDKVEFMRLQGVNIKAVFTPQDEKNAPKYKINKELESKTPGQRLRNTLYVLWEQEGAKGEFDNYYKIQMEKLIDAVKVHLE